MADYTNAINNMYQPEIQDDVFTRRIDALRGIFADIPEVSGERITETVEVARSSPAGAVTKYDVNPAAATNTLVHPYWNLEGSKFVTACEVFRDDIARHAKPGDTLAIDFVQNEIAKESLQLWAQGHSAWMTALAADIDATSAYSDASLSRSTYSVLASAEDSDSEAITLADWRTISYTCRHNKNGVSKSQYLCLMAESTMKTFQPLAAAVNGWNAAPSNQPQIMGYPDVGYFEGIRFIDPSVLYLTDGLTFFINPNDVGVREWRPFEIEQVSSGRDSEMFILRWAAKLRVKHPGRQGKMANKT